MVPIYILRGDRVEKVDRRDGISGILSEFYKPGKGRKR